MLFLQVRGRSYCPTCSGDLHPASLFWTTSEVSSTLTSHSPVLRLRMPVRRRPRHSKSAPRMPSTVRLFSENSSKNLPQFHRNIFSCTLKTLASLLSDCSPVSHIICTLLMRLQQSIIIHVYTSCIDI